MDTRGYASMRETVKVQRPGDARSMWTISDKNGQHVEHKNEQMLEAHVKDAMLGEHVAYFEAEWGSDGWKIGGRLTPHDW
jgi:hypothetical protein